MKTLLKSVAFAAALLLTAPVAANATTFIDLDPPGADGSISGVFGNTGLSGVFNDVIQFELPEPGFTSATISSIMVLSATNVDFTSVMLNGIEFLIDQTGPVEFRHISNLPTLAGTQTLTISGIAGGEGSYAGTIAFGIPEPATWAMMIIGFGMVGVGMRTLRRRQGALTPA